MRRDRDGRGAAAGGGGSTPVPWRIQEALYELIGTDSWSFIHHFLQNYFALLVTRYLRSSRKLRILIILGLYLFFDELSYVCVGILGFFKGRVQVNIF